MINERKMVQFGAGNIGRSFIGQLFARAGYEVVTAYDGLAAVETFEQVAPDLILLDLILPDLDGIEVLRRLRATNETSTVVVLTGMGGIKSATAAVR